ncbi:chemotaxis protein CheC [Paraclostridium bifermentans]|jgi:chemotaxis protein CheC|uniref:chemotaxis protein CheC n=1 Tax=Paraclostridium bifermentans TaxID=1490 RepID=UPI0011DD157E|nr:chemotaxis protein CheC [Paraclostridium bifermentans]MBS6506985.1 chemotaxis protein CheC [Paraclostridium bifermentans]MDB8986991.1 chemotaxis protein CheC [Parabacteroides merdae]MDU3802035.1 chemotaxis protein CheC [Paraclostridium bifermentans]
MNFECDKLNVFREISNIGSGNASTSLGMMLNEIVDIGIPKSDLISFSDITNSYDSPEELVVGTVLQLSGDMEGFILVIMKLDSAINLLSKVTGNNLEFDKEDYDLVRKELSSIGEICNILCGTYLTAISDMTNLSIDPSIPYFSVDMVRAIMNLPISLYGPVSDSILCIETDFFTTDNNIEGKYYFIPKVESCEKLLSSLGFAC